MDTRAVDLFVFDPDRRVFNAAESDVSCNIINSSSSEQIGYRLQLKGKDGKELVEVAISQEILPSFNDTDSDSTGFALHWVVRRADAVVCYALRVRDGSTRPFQDAFLRCLWEVATQRKFEEAKDDEKPDVAYCFEEDDDPEQAVLCEDDAIGFVVEEDRFPFDHERVARPDSDEEDEEEQEKASAALSTPPRSKIRVSVPHTPEEETLFRTPDKHHKRAAGTPFKDANSLLAVSYNSDRAFVGRGDRIGVFKQGDSSLQFYTALAPLRTPGGQVLDPTQMQLHHQDSSLLLVDHSKPKSVFRMDLERGQVVQEWQTQDPALSGGGSYPVASIAPVTKQAQRTASSVVLGFNQNSIFAIDGRLQGVQRVEQLTLTYGHDKARMSAMATTQDGHIVVGSADGSIRLFNKNTMTVPKADLLDRVPRAKTLLAASSLGFGEPITAIDVTGDGYWVLATCRTYLLLVATSATPGKGITGFSRSLGAKKPKPIILRPTKEDITRLGGVVNFTPARFNVSSGPAKERSIVTSSGNYAFTWNFLQVVEHNIRHLYYMKRFDEAVTVSQFTYDDDSKIVVALEDDVQLARRSRVARKLD